MGKRESLCTHNCTLGSNYTRTHDEKGIEIVLMNVKVIDIILFILYSNLYYIYVIKQPLVNLSSVKMIR